MFKKGDKLKPKPDYQGFQDLVVEKLEDGFYHCSIMNGKAIISQKTLEQNYVTNDVRFT